MKRTTIHISAALALLLALAACTQDEAGFLPEGAEGTCRLHAGRSGLPAGRGGRHTHRLHRHGAEPRRDSHRRYPCPGGRRLGGRAERGSQDGRHGEGIQCDALHLRQHRRHADLR